MFMKRNNPKCSICENEIQGNDVIYVRMRYPMYKGVTEITAYLRNEGTFICEECYNQSRLPSEKADMSGASYGRLKRNFEDM